MTTAARSLLAANVRQLRIEAGLSQGQLAQRAGLEARRVWALEHEKNSVGIDVLDALAVALGVDVTALLKPRG